MFWQRAVRFIARGAGSSFAAAAFAAGCGVGGTGKPLTKFPTRAELAAIAHGTPAQKPIGSDLAAVHDWKLEPIEVSKPRPERSLLASATPRAKPSAALDCVARELGRVVLAAPDKRPAIGLRRFISARCGAVAPLYAFQSWSADLTGNPSDETIVSQLRAKIDKPIDASASEAGAALVRAGEHVTVVIAYGAPQVAIEHFSQLVDAEGVFEVRGRVLLDTDQLQGLINRGEYGAARCVLDPAVAAPSFAMRCQLAPGDDYAWVQLLAIPRGRVLGQEVLGVLALRRADAGTEYQPQRLIEPRPVANADELQAAVLELVNGIRAHAGHPALRDAPQQSKIASSVTKAFFSALLSDDTAGQHVVDTIALGLLAGWDVEGGMIRGGNLTANVTIDALDAGRWLADALERPIGRAVLLDPDGRVLSIGATVQQDPAVAAAVATTYSFFEDEATPGERAMQVLERLGRVRQARGLGHTILVRDAPGVSEQVQLVHAGKATPMEALQHSMNSASQELHMPVSGFVWETQDLDAIEFPPALLKKGDLTLGAGVTYYRAPGGAWGQYTVLFVVIERGLRT